MNREEKEKMINVINDLTHEIESAEEKGVYNKIIKEEYRDGFYYGQINALSRLKEIILFEQE